MFHKGFLQIEIMNNMLEKQLLPCKPEAALRQWRYLWRIKWTSSMFNIVSSSDSRN